MPLSLACCYKAVAVLSHRVSFAWNTGAHTCDGKRGPMSHFPFQVCKTIRILGIRDRVSKAALWIRRHRFHSRCWLCGPVLSPTAPTLAELAWLSDRRAVKARASVIPRPVLIVRLQRVLRNQTVLERFQGMPRIRNGYQAVLKVSFKEKSATIMILSRNT